MWTRPVQLARTRQAVRRRRHRRRRVQLAAVTALASAFSTISGTKTATGTPAIADLIIIVTVSSGSTATTTPTDDNTDGLGTYTLITSALANGSVDIICIYVRNRLIGSASSTIFTHAPGTTTGGGLQVLKVTGMTRIGLNAILQNAAQANQGAGGTPAPVFGAVPKTGNPVITGIINGANPGGVTVRTGYTSRTDNGWNLPATGIDVCSLDSGETSATITWGGTSGTAFGSLAIELDITAPERRTAGPRVGSRSQ